MKNFLLLIIITGAVICGSLLFMLNRGASRVPPNLLGTWVTNSVGYEDRYIVMQEETLVFGTGGNSSDHCYIIRVREKNIGSGISYTINYENDKETKFKLNFVYKKEQQETIIINHMESIVWIKKEGDEK